MTRRTAETDAILAALEREARRMLPRKPRETGAIIGRWARGTLPDGAPIRCRMVRPRGNATWRAVFELFGSAPCWSPASKAKLRARSGLRQEPPA
jgi:hypothetical protein